MTEPTYTEAQIRAALIAEYGQEDGNSEADDLIAAMAAGGSATPAEPCDDGCCKNEPCDFDRPSAGRATQGAAPTPAALVLCTECGEPWHPHRSGENFYQRRDEPQGTQSTRDPNCGLTHEHSPTDRCGGTA